MAEERYIDPNSGAAPQPGGYAAAPVLDDGQFDAAVADEVTEAQEAEEPADDADDARESQPAADEKSKGRRRSTRK